MPVLREILTRFGLDFDQAAYKRANSATDALRDSARRLALAVGTGFVVNALRRTIAETISTAAATDDLAQKVGVSAQALQELSFAAKLSGIEAETMQRGISLLTKASAEAASGNEEASKKFSEFGIRVRGANGQIKTADVLMGEIADRMKGATSQAERLRIATTFFGERGGGKFAVALKDGSEGLARLRQEARDLGGVMDSSLIASAAEADDNFDRLAFALQGAKNTLTSALLPAILETQRNVLEWVKANRRLINERIATWAKAAAQGAVTFAKAARDAFNVVGSLIEMVGGLRNVFIALGAYLGIGLAAQIGQTILALGALSARAVLTQIAMAAIPIAIGIAFVALTAIIALVGQEIFALFSPMRGLFEELAGKWGALRDSLLEGVDANEFWLLKAFRFVAIVVVDLFDKVDRFFAFVFDGAIAIQDAIIGIGPAFDLLVLRGKQAVENVFGFFKGLIDDVGQLLAAFFDANPFLQGAIRATNFIGGKLGFGADQRLSTTPLSDAVLAQREASFAPSVSVNVDASGQNLDEFKASDLITRSISDALTNVNRDALRALTPALAD